MPTPSTATTSKREKAAKNLTTFAKAVQAVAKPAVSLLVWILPLAISYCRFLHASWKKIPYDASTFLIGIVFCFFGGLYPTLFAALQAAKHSGISVSHVVTSLVKQHMEFLLFVIAYIPILRRQTHTTHMPRTTPIFHTHRPFAWPAHLLPMKPS